MLRLLPFLAVIGSAAFAGVMLAIGLILGAFWRSLSPVDFLAWFQTHSPLVQRTIPFVVVPTLLGLAGSLWLSWSDLAARIWWLGALGCIAAVLVLTAVYFLPTNAGFVGGGILPDEVPRRLDAWLALHWVRIALALAAAVFGMIAATR